MELFIWLILYVLLLVSVLAIIGIVLLINSELAFSRYLSMEVNRGRDSKTVV